MAVRPNVGARVRSRIATRFTTRAVRLLSTLPPLILLPGHKPSHAQNALALLPVGFTTAEVAQAVRDRNGWDEAQYPTRRAAYDLAKVQGKGLVERVPGRRRYECRPEQLRVLCGDVVL